MGCRGWFLSPSSSTMPFSPEVPHWILSIWLADERSKKGHGKPYGPKLVVVDITFDPHSINENSLTWSRLLARKSGNFSLAVCPGRRGKWVWWAPGSSLTYSGLSETFPSYWNLMFLLGMFTVFLQDLVPVYKRCFLCCILSHWIQLGHIIISCF